MSASARVLVPWPCHIFKATREWGQSPRAARTRGLAAPARLCLVGLILASVASAAEVTTLSGKKLTGDVIAISRTGITLKTTGGEDLIPVADVLLMELNPTTAAKDDFAEIELTDGSTLACVGVAFKGADAELTLVGGPVLRCPLAAVSTLLQNAHDPAVRQQWQLLLRKRGALDMLVVSNESKLDALDGAFGRGSDSGDAIEFTPSGADQKLSPKLKSTAGLVFVRRPNADAPPAFCQLVDTAGNLLFTKTVKLDGDAVVVDTVAGGATRYPNLKAIARLDFSKGKLTYLSDIEPVEINQTSTEDLVFPFKRDRNLYGGPLRLGRVPYSKGLALHSRTMLTYDIGGEYKELRAMLGVDDVVAVEGGAPVRVNVVIDGDGRELFKGEVRTRDAPKPLALDVKGVRRLRIAVTSPLLDLGNQVNLCDARVSK